MKNNVGKFEKVRYSEYLGFFVLLIVFLLIYSLVIFTGEKLYGVISDVVLNEVGFLFEFGSAVGIILLAGICYYTFDTSKNARIFQYFGFFLVSGIFMAQFLFNYRWMNVEYSFSYSVLSRLFLFLGLFIGGAIDEEKIVKAERGKYRASVIIFIVITIGLIEFVNGPMSIMHHILSFIDANLIVLEFGISLFLLGAISFAIKRYDITKNTDEMKFCIGLTGLLVSQLMRISTVRFDSVEYMGYTLLQVIGVAYILVAFYRFFVAFPRYELMKAENQIKLYADNLEKIIEKRTDEIRETNSQLISEIEYAKSIQQSLLPSKRLNFRNAMFVSEYFPCERLSGDFYDIYRIDEDHIGMYVLDVSGHGVSAALMTMFCNNYVKSTEKLIQRYRGLKPHRNLKHFYEEFNKMNFPDEMHMVIFFASYNLETQELTYSSGGMNCYPILMKSDGTNSYLDQSQGFPICKMSQFITPEYESVKLKLEKGDRIIFYTDGLIDKAKNGMLGEEELIEVLKEGRNKSLRVLDNTLVEILKPILSDIDDDITYFIMEV